MPNKADVGSRDGLIARICRTIVEAPDVAGLINGVCDRLVAELGSGASARVETGDAPADPGALAAPLYVDRRRYGTLVVVPGAGARDEDAAFVATAAGLMGPAIRRFLAVEALRANEQRLEMAQRIARLGSYDWEIATDTNIWSDELYTIYGTVPQSFNPSYETFLSFIHPDDREAVVAVHQRAYETGEPYQMEERIVRPDGDVRTLVSNGEVIMGPDGKPARMIGICMDVTELRRAEAASRQNDARFRGMIESAPDAVLLVDADGRIVHANARAETLFGYAPSDLAAMNVDQLLPPEVRGDLAGDRASHLKNPVPQPIGAGMDVNAHRKDGTEVFVDVALGQMTTDGGVLVVAYVRDATSRREAESAQRSLLDAGQRRRQALEINDAVVQGLVTALTAVEAGRFDLGAEAVERTLQSARALMTGLLGEDRPPLPGELVRAHPVDSHLASPTLAAVSGPESPHQHAVPAGGRRRLVIADDSEDLRLLLRMLLGRSDSFDVVGEAADGQEAVDLIRDLQPDLVLLDLAMPRMDGLEAIPVIQDVSPGTRIVVLSGFDAGRMKDTVMGLGADAYIEKGSSMTGIAGTLAAICDAARPVTAGRAATGAGAAMP